MNEKFLIYQLCIYSMGWKSFYVTNINTSSNFKTLKKCENCEGFVPAFFMQLLLFMELGACDCIYSVVQFVQGKTGFPWIDAIMRQLVSEGWIHHLARQAVGCFLTRGALWICWEEGFKVCVKSFSLAPVYLQNVYN